MPIDVTIIPPDFSRSMVGAISWPKVMGRPNKPHLSDGFSIIVLGWDLVDLGGNRLKLIQFPLIPKLEEDNSASDKWRLVFSLDGLHSIEGLTKQALLLGAIDPATQHQIEKRATYTVTLNRLHNVAWTPPAGPAVITPVRVDPKEYTFMKHDGALVLPEFGMTDSFF